MTDYSFWQDFFDTYQSLSDLVKILWLIVPPLFVLALVAIVLYFKVRSKEAKQHTPPHHKRRTSPSP